MRNYDYNLNGVFFKDLKLADPDIYLEAVGSDLGETMGNIIAKSYQLMVATGPDAVLVLGVLRQAQQPTNCLIRHAAVELRYTQFPPVEAHLPRLAA